MAGNIISKIAIGEVEYELEGINYRSITTAGTGAAYTATVSGVDTLTSGVSFIMIPHTVSTSTTPTLNVNSLGAKQIRRRLSSIATAPTTGYSANWLAVGKPFRVVYDGTYWIAEGHDKPVAADLYGTLAVEKGGTGATTAEEARENLGINLITGTGAPATSTIGMPGQTYYDESTGSFYQCVAVTVGTTTEYTWAPVVSDTGSGSDGVDMTLMRGPIIVTSTQTIDLSKWGIEINDPINVICVGGGGGGGDSYGAANASGTNPGYGSGGDGGVGRYNSTSSKCYGGGGGGGSGYVKQLSMFVTSLSVAITIGSGGAVGGNGGTTSFGSYLSASGGKAGSEGSTGGSAGAGGAGGNPGEAGGDSTGSLISTVGAGGKGGIGVINVGTFSVDGLNCGIGSGSGCVMIWY